MLITAFVVALSGPVAASLHTQSASARPISHVVRERSAVTPSEPVRQICYRGKRTGSNVIDDLCRLVPVDADKQRPTRR